MKRKLLNELSTDELLGSIEEGLDQVEEQNIVHDNILEFISHYRIKKGTEAVKKRVLYKIFKNWSKAQDYGPNYFHTQLAQYFYTDKLHVYIDVNAIDLTKKAKEVFFSSEKSTGISPNFRDKHLKVQLEEFIKEYKVVDGEYYVIGEVLYYLYEGWAISNKRKPMTLLDFVMLLKFFIRNEAPATLIRKTVFLIDKKKLNIGATALEKAKTWAEKVHEKEKKKRQQTFLVKARKNKVSRPKART